MWGVGQYGVLIVKLIPLFTYYMRIWKHENITLPAEELRMNSNDTIPYDGWYGEMCDELLAAARDSRGII